MGMFTFVCPNCAEIKLEVFTHTIITEYVHATPRETGGNDGVLTQEVISVHLEDLSRLQT